MFWYAIADLRPVVPLVRGLFLAQTKILLFLAQEIPRLLPTRPPPNSPQEVESGAGVGSRPDCVYPIRCKSGTNVLKFI